MTESDREHLQYIIQRSQYLIDKILEDTEPMNFRDEERFVLGAILSGGIVPQDFSAADFSDDRNRRIFRAARELDERRQPIDRVTIANELMKRGELSLVGGLSYIVGLTDD
jgi:replicative DNA helicase